MSKKPKRKVGSRFLVGYGLGRGNVAYGREHFRKLKGKTCRLNAYAELMTSREARVAQKAMLHSDGSKIFELVEWNPHEKATP